MTLLLALMLYANDPVIVNLNDGKWVKDSIELRTDATTGAYDILVRYPSGHVFAPHMHSVNERIVMIEGQLAIGKGAEAKTLDPGGFAFLPAKEAQYLKCVSKTRCTFYLGWDGKLDFTPVK